ncbi:MAG: cupin domain-containing protein [Candidatus Omnitrophica bacterium]|nr:cupin domain-containing protein [Candidatus Omnitrophota bacterium]
MKIGEKIKQKRKELGLSIKEFLKNQKNLFPKEKILSHTAFSNIENGKTAPSFTTLEMTASVFGLALFELLADTELEENFLIKRKKRHDSFYYNENAFGEVISPFHSAFRAIEMHLEPGAKTIMECSPDAPDIKYEKLIYVLSGRLKIFWNDKKHLLYFGDSLTINSSKPHYFENTHIRPCVFLVFSNPKQY